MKVHPTSVVSSEVTLEDDVEIGPYCNIQGQVKIGQGTFVEGHVTIGSRFGIVEIGKNNHIAPGAVIGGPPQCASTTTIPRLAFSPTARWRYIFELRSTVRYD